MRERERQFRTWWGWAKYESTKSRIRGQTKTEDDSMNKKRELPVNFRIARENGEKKKGEN